MIGKYEENIVEVDWHKRPKTRNAILGGLRVKASPLVSQFKSPIPLLSLSLDLDRSTPHRPGKREY